MSTWLNTHYGFAYPLTVMRSKRKKSIGFSIKHNAITLRVPFASTAETIQQAVSSKQQWLTTKIKELQQHPPPQPRPYEHGDSLPYLGETFTLALHDSTEKIPQAVHVDRQQLHLQLPPQLLQQRRQRQMAIHHWYQQQASDYLRQRTHHYANIIAVKPQKLRIKNYRSRWGSCSSQAVISYDWRLVMMPVAVIDYVVIHELCHLIELNHSPRFWQLVQRYCPAYKQQQQWLRANEHHYVAFSP